jgi:HK97 family phage major capsid protein
VTASVITIAGQQDLSRQAFERSAAAGTGLEQVLGADLAADYAKQIDIQVLRGSGSSGQALGLVNVSSPNTVSYTTSSPVVAGSATAADNLYPKIGNAIQQIHTNRFLPPTAIIMHPRRFAWMMSASDTQGRPLVVPVAQATNTIGLLERVGSENVVGSIQGVPVIVDANIATNTGAGTNQDTIIVTRLEDQWLWEDTPKVRVFEEVLSNTGQIRIQLFAYAAFTGSRYAKATSLITGTGLVTPTF